MISFLRVQTDTVLESSWKHVGNTSSWSGPAGGPRGDGQLRQWGKGVRFDLQWRQIVELWEPCQELSYLEGCHSHISGGQIREMWGPAKEASYHVVSWVAVGAGWVICTAYDVAVRLEPRVVAGSELGEGTSLIPWQQLFGWVYWRESSHEHFVGCLRLDSLLTIRWLGCIGWRALA